MVRTIFLCLSIILSFHFSFAAMDPNSKALDRFFAATDMNRMMDATILKLVAGQMQQNPSLKPVEADFIAFFREHLSFKVLEKDFRRMYAEKFTEQEINEITTFYLSSAGKKVASLVPEMTTEAIALGNNKIKADLPAFLEKIKPKLAKPAKPTK